MHQPFLVDAFSLASAYTMVIDVDSLGTDAFSKASASRVSQIGGVALRSLTAEKARAFGGFPAKAGMRAAKQSKSSNAPPRPSSAKLSSPPRPPCESFAPHWCAFYCCTPRRRIAVTQEVVHCHSALQNAPKYVYIPVYSVCMR